MNKGSTYLARNPYGFGPHRIGGLGDDAPYIDYGTAARESALARSTADRLARNYDQQDAMRLAQERQQILEITERASKGAAKASVNLLTSGQNQLRRLMSVGGGVAVVALGVLAFVAVRSKKSSRSGSRSRRKKSSVVQVPEFAA